MPERIDIPLAVTAAIRPRATAGKSKGDRSREAILRATLVSIAKHGLGGTTHRSIAKLAGVPHSLTTYFFGTLDELIEAAFDYFVELSGNDVIALMREAAVQLASVSASDRRNPAVLNPLLSRLTRRLADFILHEASTHAVGIAVELNLLYMYRKPGPLREKAVRFRAHLVAQIAELITLLSDEDVQHASTDASLFLTVLHRLALECVNEPAAPPRAMVERELYRLLEILFAMRQRQPPSAAAAG